MGFMDPRQQTVLLIFSGLLGLVVGSFLNVCIFRLPRHCMSIVKPRSRCPKCLTWIAWYDNLPVISWTVLGGKCRHCKNPISIRYTLVELLTGVLFLWAGYRALYLHPKLGGVIQPSAWEVNYIAQFILEAWFISALIVSTFIDLEFQILPDEITLSGIVIGLAASAAFPFLHKEDLVRSAIREPYFASLTASALGALVGGGSIWLVGKLGKWVFRKEAMGFGDVKYMAMVGALLGWRGVLLTFMIACIIGSVYGIGKKIVTREMGYVPFGPFLSAGALAMLFFTPEVNWLLDAYMAWNERLLGGAH
jgi:leader peptidase (prepilin peptidase) / N-methyltransferase